MDLVGIEYVSALKKKKIKSVDHVPTPENRFAVKSVSIDLDIPF